MDLTSYSKALRQLRSLQRVRGGGYYTARDARQSKGKKVSETKLPLPAVYSLHNAAAAVAAEFNSYSSTNALPCPSQFMVYVFEISSEKGTWKIYRRYSPPCELRLHFGSSHIACVCQVSRV